jgi:hypothetical protein
LFGYFGIPHRIITDRGTAFTSAKFEEFCKQNEHIKTAVRSPRANGQAERYNKTILAALKCYQGSTDNRRWVQFLRDIQWSLNTTKHSITQFSPHELLFSYKPRDIMGNKLLLELQEATMCDEDEIQDRRQTALERINKNQEIQAIRFNSKHRTPEKYQVDDLVLVMNDVQATGDSKKLEPVYKGPYIVTAVLPHDRYQVEDIPGIQRKQKRFVSIFAADRMKRWCQLPYEDDVSENDVSDDEVIQDDGEDRRDDD